MRIALFVHCYFPEHFFGTEAYTRSVARELMALGHEATVVTATFHGESRQDALIERYEHDGVPVIRIDRNIRPSRNVRETYDLPELRTIHEQILREIQPDVVHVCHLTNHTAALLETCAAMRLPTFATFTDFFGFCYTNILRTAAGGLCDGPDEHRANCVECYLAGRKSKSATGRFLGRPPMRPHVAAAYARHPVLAIRKRPTIEAMIARPDFLRAAFKVYRGAIAPSRFLKQAYVRNGFDRPLRISHFGIDIDRSEKPAREGAGTRFAYVGQLAAHKGVHLLIEAFRQLPDSEASLDIWGAESQDPAYAARLRQLADGQRVTFRGTFEVAKIAEVLSGIDVLAIPSTWFENSPLILLQALATHTPVLVTDVEGLTEFVEPGVSGFWFPKGDVGALAAEMRRFVDDDGLAARMSATTRYERTSRTMVEDVVALYGDLAQQRPDLLAGNQ